MSRLGPRDVKYSKDSSHNKEQLQEQSDSLDSVLQMNLENVMFLKLLVLQVK